MSLYLVLDGVDGCGKSSQASLLTAWAIDRGHDVVHLREPGSTPLGEALRRLLLDRDGAAMSPLTEALLFTAARAEMVRELVAPALAKGKVVIAERCFLSTLVYQGIAPTDESARVPLPLLRELGRRAHGITMPDRIVVLDLDVDVARARRAHQNPDRIEARDRGYHQRVREGFLGLAREEAHCAVVDASGSHEDVQRRLRAVVEPLLPRPR